MTRPCVAHFVDRYLFRNGGWIHGQIAHLSRWRATVLCGRTDNLHLYGTERIHALLEGSMLRRSSRAIGLRLMRYSPFFVRVLRQEQAGILHAHFGTNGCLALVLSRACRIPLITTFYGSDVSRVPRQSWHWRRRYRQLFEHGTLFLAEGPYMRRQLIRLGCSPAKIAVKPLGVDLEVLRYVPRGHADRPLRILVAATFAEKKGLRYAVEAFGRLRREGLDATLTLVGDARGSRPEERAIKARLFEIVNRYGVADEVVFKGFVEHEELVRQFYLHHLLVAPSVQAADGDNEGGAPVTILEAMATGMPVVATRHCDIPEIIRHNVDGCLVAERSVDELVEKIGYLGTDPTRRAELGRNARQRIESAYDVRFWSQQLEDIYDGVRHAASPPRAPAARG